MRDKVGIDEDAVRRAERGVCGEEHVCWSGLDVAGDFIAGFVLLVLLGLLGGLFEALVAGFDCSFCLDG